MVEKMKRLILAGIFLFTANLLFAAEPVKIRLNPMGGN